MSETPRTPGVNPGADTPDSAPYDNRLRETSVPDAAPTPEELYREQPAAGVTDVYGESLAGDAEGGAPESQ